MASSTRNGGPDDCRTVHKGVKWQRMAMSQIFYESSLNRIAFEDQSAVEINSALKLLKD